MPAENKKLNWGLIGCGDLAEKRIAPAMNELDDCSLLAVNRADFTLAKDFAQKFGAEKFYKTTDELLSDNDIQAVYIATPNYLHAPLTIAAAKAGKHVLCEKPMAMTLDECDQMIAACSENNVKLAVAYYRRFYPAVKRIKHILADGTIGMPVFAQINAFTPLNIIRTDKRAWLIEKEKAGGGPMFDIGCHRIDLLLQVFGKVSSVKGYTSNVALKFEVEDTASAIITFQSGTCAVLNTSWAASEYQDTFDIFGTKGSIHAPSLNKGLLEIKTADTQTTENHPSEPNRHKPLIKDFTDAVLTDRPPQADPTIAREVNRIEHKFATA